MLGPGPCRRELLITDAARKRRQRVGQRRRRLQRRQREDLDRRSRSHRRSRCCESVDKVGAECRPGVGGQRLKIRRYTFKDWLGSSSCLISIHLEVLNTARLLLPPNMFDNLKHSQ